MKLLKLLLSLTSTIYLIGCATVRQQDLDAWVNKPVDLLDKHPFFITVPYVKSIAADGTEIRNYVNGGNLSECSSNGAIFGKTLNSSAYAVFASCVSRVAACNNIFYIKNGLVEKYLPIGTGGMSCYTNEFIQPNPKSSFNVR